MVDKENPPSEPASESECPVDAIFVSDPSDEGEGLGDSIADSAIVTAQLVMEDSGNGDAKLPEANLAAQGGVVASVVLGTWSIIGAAITSYSIINAFLGLALGCWGMSSNVRWPWLGIALSVIGIACCAIAAAGG